MTKKTIYIRVKRQDGGVEDTSPSAGRGNIHERVRKYFTPILRKILSEKGEVFDTLPFWAIFVGPVTRDPK